MLVLMAVVVVVAGFFSVNAKKADAATNQIRGMNWADTRDNFQSGVIYPSGLSSSDTYSSAATVADRVVGQLYSITGANTVRMPINEPTVANYWGTYTGAIDEALTKGNVILAYWAYNRSYPVSISAFDSMWDRVIARYGSNSRAYFEVINEPGYSASTLDNFYYSWLNRYSSIPRGRVILDGSSGGRYAAPVGSDSRLANTLLSVHCYDFYESPPGTSESQWASEFASLVGGYASRTVATEFGAPMSAGVDRGNPYPKLDYSKPSTSEYYVAYLRGVTDEMHALGMGSVYWAGLRDGDTYSMVTRSGSGSSISLSLVNASGLGRVQYGWGYTAGGAGSDTTPPSVPSGVRVAGVTSSSVSLSWTASTDNVGVAGYQVLRNGTQVGTATGTSFTDTGLAASTAYSYSVKAFDAAGNVSGASAAVSATTAAGGGGSGYVRFQNHATGLFIDGMGLTSNGSNAGQYSSSTSYNQQWQIVADGSYVRLQNRATGLFLDGEGRTTNGSAVGQWSDSTSNNQQWTETTTNGYVRFQNRATGLFIDGEGRTANGSDLGQWSSSTSSNQQWLVVSS